MISLYSRLADKKQEYFMLSARIEDLCGILSSQTIGISIEFHFSFSIEMLKIILIAFNDPNRSCIIFTPIIIKWNSYFLTGKTCAEQNPLFDDNFLFFF